MSLRYIKIFLGFLLLISLAASLVFQKKTTLDFQISIGKIVYSPNQKFLLIGGNNANSSTFLLSKNGLRPSTVASQKFTLPNGDSVNSVAFDNDNTYLAIGDKNGGVNLYSAQNGTFKQLPDVIETGVNNQIFSIAFSKDGSQIAAGLGNGIISIIDVASKTVKRTLNFGLRAISTLAFSPANDDLLVVGGVVNSGVIVFNVSDETVKYQKNFTDKCLIATFSSDGSHFYINSGGILFDYQSNGFNNINNITIQGQTNLQYIQISKNSKYITISTITQLHILKAQDWSPNQVPIASIVNSHALGSDAGSLAVGSSANQIDIYQLCLIDGQFYSDANECADCLSPCATCVVSAAFCQSCVERYFLQNNSCQKCILGCLQCSNNKQCLSCDQKENFQLVDNICICKGGYYLDEQKKICQLCMPGCTSCLQADVCQTCDTANHFILSPTSQKCQCQVTYRQQDRQCINCGKGCLLCNSSSCEKCNDVQHWTQQQQPNYDCVCNNNDHFVEKPPGTCSCADSFFPQKNKCQKCPLICSLCDSLKKCTSCNGEAIIINDMCQCPDKTFFNQTTLKCDPCGISYCIKCQSSQICNLCDLSKNRTLNDEGQCVCKQAYYEDDQKNCLSCGMVGCKVCNDSKTCTLCDNNKHRQLNAQNKCICQKHYYEDNQQCSTCIDGCLQCLQGTSCQKCDEQANWHLQNNTICYCNEGHYDGKQQICKLCSEGCKQCISGQLCQNCYTENHYQIDIEDNETCICEPGYYNGSWTVCLKCDLPACILCSNAQTCTQCHEGFYIKDGLCKCPQEKYADENKCQNCQSPCILCKSKDQCESCIDEYTLDGTKCQKDGISAGSVVVIVLIVVGILALIGAGVAVIKYCRKKKAKSVLQQQGEYQPVN